MTTQYILSIDSGMSSGCALGKFDNENLYQLVKAWQVEGGLEGLLEWLHANLLPAFRELDWGSGAGSYPQGLDFGPTLAYKTLRSMPGVHVVAEKFQPINHENYALTRDSVEPLRCEGALIALGVMPHFPDPTWRQPKEMYLYGGRTLAEKKKRAYAFLKANQMYVTGKTVGCKDANDARSAILHGISYASRVLKHEPTSRMIQEFCHV